MFFIISVQGCLPWITVEIGRDGDPKTFQTEAQAEKWAKKNCTWEYQIVEFKLRGVTK